MIFFTQEFAKIADEFTTNEARRKVKFTSADRLKVIIAYNFCYAYLTKYGSTVAALTVLNMALRALRALRRHVEEKLVSRLMQQAPRTTLRMVAGTDDPDMNANLLTALLVRADYNFQWTTEEEVFAWPMLAQGTGADVRVCVEMARLFAALSYTTSRHVAPTARGAGTQSFEEFYAGFIKRLQASRKTKQVDDAPGACTVETPFSVGSEDIQAAALARVEADKASVRAGVTRQEEPVFTEVTVTLDPLAPVTAITSVDAAAVKDSINKADTQKDVVSLLREAMDEEDGETLTVEKRNSNYNFVVWVGAIVFTVICIALALSVAA